MNESYNKGLPALLVHLNMAMRSVLMMPLPLPT
jgi:hypothetical protein